MDRDAAVELFFFVSSSSVSLSVVAVAKAVTRYDAYDPTSY